METYETDIHLKKFIPNLISVILIITSIILFEFNGNNIFTKITRILLFIAGWSYFVYIQQILNNDQNKDLILGLSISIPIVVFCSQLLYVYLSNKKSKKSKGDNVLIVIVILNLILSGVYLYFKSFNNIEMIVNFIGLLMFILSLIMFKFKKYYFALFLTIIGFILIAIGNSSPSIM